MATERNRNISLGIRREFTHFNNGNKHESIGIWEIAITIRRLAIANRSHVSIYVTKNFGYGSGAVNRVKIFLTSSLITMHNLVAGSLLCARTQKVPTFWGRLGPTARNLGTWLSLADPLKHAPALCYHTKFGRSGPNRRGVSKGPKMEDAGPHPLRKGRLTPRKRPSPRFAIQNFVAYRSNNMGVSRGLRNFGDAWFPTHKPCTREENRLY